ncbi:MAG: ABC transporter ATP-binding protein [Candidatus Saccharibacteria bacterium]
MDLKKELNKTWASIIWVYNYSRPFWPGILAILVLGVVDSLGRVVIAIASKNMIDYAVKGDLKLAAFAAGGFGILVLILMGSGIISSLVSVKTSEAMSNNMRQQIFQQLTDTEWLRLSSYHSGDLITRMTSDIGVITNVVVSVIPGMVALAVQFTAAFFTLLHYEPKLAILAFFLGPVAVLFSRVWGRTLKRYNTHIMESESNYRSYIQESLQNLMIIKVFQLEDYSREALQDLHQKRMFWVIRRNRFNLGASATLGFGFWVGYFTAFCWGAYRLSQKAISFGTLTAFLQLVQQIQNPFVGLARTFPQLIAAFASCDRLMELEELDKEDDVPKLEPKEEVGLAFQQASFAYPDGQKVLEKISIRIEPGEIVALTGSSGEGKTTMIRLLLALLRPVEGKVCFIDRNEQEYEVSAATREWVSYVPQGNTLFSGLISTNLRRGKPDATEEEMEQAARTACAWSFVEELPNRFDTVIGEGGLGLSEGQAQRLAIARALLKKAPVLILDEATSALDMVTEIKVLQEIKNLDHNPTCLVITHRPSALKICSRVLRLEDGMLTEETE